MPKTSRSTASRVQEVGPVTDRASDLDDTTASFTAFAIDIDGTPLLKGLPDDRCQCPHWGYVFKGSATFTFADRAETFDAGDAFYVGPGHTPAHTADSEVLLFSPKDELRATAETMMRNMQELMSQH
jgi:hypothetical protein